MKIEDLERKYEEKSVDELTEIVLENRRNKTTTQSTKVAAVKKKVVKKNIKSEIGNLSPTEKAQLIARLKGLA